MKRIALLFVAAALAVVACNEGRETESPVAPAVTFQPEVNQGQAAPQAEPPEDDASGGRGISAEFDAAWTLTTTSTNRHANHGYVCMTDGFKGPGVGRYPWSNPGTTTSAPSVKATPFDLGAVDIDWKKGECERQVVLQLDAYGGDSCSGHILAVVYPSERTVRTIKNPECEQCDPGEWEPIGEPVVVLDGQWGSCDVQAATSGGCHECKEVTYQQTFSNGCEEEVRTWGKVERREVECGPSCEDFDPEITVEWNIIEQEAEGGVLAAGHHCNAIYSGIVITPSICAPPFDIDPELPHLVPAGTSQLFTFTWAGTYEPADGLVCPLGGQETDLVEAPEEGMCYYEVDCRSSHGFQASTFCSFFDKKGICEDAGGAYLDVDPRAWVTNFQCEFDLPGVSNDRFQLSPGRSHDACLRKQD